ncbi:hypothetical protein [Cohnella sp. AR92]|uniref:hypothetical protein n=1 Tax=Cohnella sp. AR92 TaxID=648716 RepID=UPI000F8F48BD|nr:hypothetical protein [Cohnella sp. AR92]RUS41954.1 hypothetical protein ELR57_27590 [Cohnella sp. AR92]
MEILTSILTSTIVAGIVVSLFQAYYKFKADKNLEQYKQSLSQLTENLKFDLQRRIQDFSLYTNKRHEKLPELFRLLLIADSKIRGLFGGRRSLTFQEFNRKDIEKYLLEHQVPQGKIETVLIAWSVNKEEAIKEMNEYLRVIEFSEARKSFYEAKNFYILSELYLTEVVTDLAERFLKALGDLLIYSEYPEPGTHNNRFELHAELDNITNQLRNALKQELGISYYK